MHPEAIATVTAHLGEVGNASSLHASGRRAGRVVEESREKVAAALDGRPSEVLFTGGGTEGDSLLVKGLYWARRAADPRRSKVVISSIEHHAVIDAAEWLAAEQGAEVVWLPVDAIGRVSVEALRAELARDPDAVALVSVMWANNEIGSVQSIADLAAVAHEFDVPFHTDAVQAIGSLPVSFAASGVDAMTITGHKFGGPYGAGAVLLRRGLEVTPLTHGGGQEREVRSGTLDVPVIAGLAVATEIAVAERPERAARVGALRDSLLAGVIDVVPDALLNGPAPGPARLPGNAHLSFPGCAGDSLLMLLDARGVECSTGSACSARVARPPHVLVAVGADTVGAAGSLLLSLGHSSTEADVSALVDATRPAVERGLRAG